MNKLLAIVLALACVGVSAAEDKDWGLVASVEGGTKIHAKYGSYDQADGVGFLLVRFASKTGNINFYIAAVSAKSCDAGFGEVGFFDTTYKPLRKESYVKKGGNGIAAIGDLICAVMDKKRSIDL